MRPDPHEPQMHMSKASVAEAHIPPWQRAVAAFLEWWRARWQAVPDGECANCPVEREKTRIWQERAEEWAMDNLRLEELLATEQMKSTPRLGCWDDDPIMGPVMREAYFDEKPVIDADLAVASDTPLLRAPLWKASPNEWAAPSAADRAAPRPCLECGTYVPASAGEWPRCPKCGTPLPSAREYRERRIVSAADRSAARREGHALKWPEEQAAKPRPLPPIMRYATARRREAETGIPVGKSAMFRGPGCTRRDGKPAITTAEIMARVRGEVSRCSDA